MLPGEWRCEIQEATKLQSKSGDSTHREVVPHCPLYGCPRIEPSTEVSAYLLGCVLLEGGGCSSYLKCRTVETVNGVACAAREFVHAFEVNLHVVRASDSNGNQSAQHTQEPQRTVSSGIETLRRQAMSGPSEVPSGTLVDI